MNHKEWLELHQKLTKKMYDITAAKNADYTGGDSKDDAFANFRMVETFGAATAEQGFATRMTDKLARICTYIRKETLLVKDEGVEDTLLDLANYCLLFVGYLQAKKDNDWTALERRKNELHRTQHPVSGHASNPVGFKGNRNPNVSST